MLHPELRRQLGKDNVVAITKAAEERCRTTPMTIATPKPPRRLHSLRLRSGASRAPDATTI